LRSAASRLRLPARGRARRGRRDPAHRRARLARAAGRARRLLLRGKALRCRRPARLPEGERGLRAQAARAARGAFGLVARGGRNGAVAPRGPGARPADGLDFRFPPGRRGVECRPMRRFVRAAVLGFALIALPAIASAEAQVPAVQLQNVQKTPPKPGIFHYTEAKANALKLAGAVALAALLVWGWNLEEKGEGKKYRRQRRLAIG